MSDLYDQAADLPRLLSGGRSVHTFTDLRRVGRSRSAIEWARRRERLIRPFRSVYLAGAAVEDLLDRLRAALRVLPPSAVFGHHTAAALYGFGVVPTSAVHVCVPAGTPVPQRRGVVAHESVLPFDEVLEVFGLPCLSPARSAVDLARTLPRPDGLASLDAGLRSGVCTVEDVLSELGRHDRLRGIRRARELAVLATPLAECRQESHLRLILHDAGLPTPVPQLAVVDEWGVERYRIDLGFEEQQVGVEYDGASHLDRARMRADRRRHNWLSGMGWRMRYVTGGELYNRPELTVATIQAALAGRRSWN